MKFYYNGKLVRTSKTHEYKFAAMLDGRCLKSSATREGAQEEIERSLRELNHRIEAEKNALKALESGESMFRSGKNWVKIDRKWHTAENLTKWIKADTETRNHIKANAQVVELEARA